MATFFLDDRFFYVLARKHCSVSYCFHPDLAGQGGNATSADSSPSSLPEGLTCSIAGVEDPMVSRMSVAGDRAEQRPWLVVFLLVGLSQCPDAPCMCGCSISLPMCAGHCVLLSNTSWHEVCGSPLFRSKIRQMAEKKKCKWCMMESGG